VTPRKDGEKKTEEKAQAKKNPSKEVENHKKAILHLGKRKKTVVKKPRLWQKGPRKKDSRGERNPQLKIRAA